MHVKLCLFFTFLILPHIFFSQEDSLAKTLHLAKSCEIRMYDGSSYKGTIEKQNDSLVWLKATSGVLIQIPKKHIASIDPANESRKKDSLNPAKSKSDLSIGRRYYVTTSNAMLFRQKEVYLSSSYLVLYNINYAFDEHFSLGISSTVIGAPLGLHVKANFALGPNLYIGAEGVAGGAMYLSPKTYGLGGAMKLTFGDVRRNYTFFGGYADLNIWMKGGGRFYQYRNPSYYLRLGSPFAGVAAFLPMSHRFSFVAEAFAFPGVAIYTGSAAIRTMGWQKLSFVFGIQVIGNMSANVNRAFTLPYFGFSMGF